MWNKPKDIPYCGCDIEKIKQANPLINPERLKLYVYYQWERTKIYYLKNVKQNPPPWTEDEILANYRFTNTRRELDKESQWLIQNILNNPKVDYENKLLNAFVFRYINKHETFENLIQPIFDDVWIDFSQSTQALHQKLAELDKLAKSYKQTIINGAYMLSGAYKFLNLANKKLNFVNADFHNICKGIAFVNHYKNYILNIAELPPNEFKNKISKLPSCSSRFLPYQIWVDWTYIGAYTPNTTDVYPYSENEFVVSGIGCYRGIMWLINHNPNNLSGLTEEEFIFWFRDNLPQLAEKYKLKWQPKEMFHFLPPDQRNWGVMQIENSFCEFDKYCRTFYNKKRPKQRYSFQRKQEIQTHKTENRKINKNFVNMI